MTTTSPLDANNDAIIAARGVNFWFGEGELKKQILFDVELEIMPGEVVLITGPSGSGKTTLLTLIAALRTLARRRLAGVWQGIAERRDTHASFRPPQDRLHFSSPQFAAALVGAR